jgi:hypothetical protein
VAGANGPGLARYVTAYNLTPAGQANFNTVYKFAVENVSLFRDINDLIERLWNPHVTPVNCGRVIESICRMISPPARGTTDAAWKAMQRALNLSEAYLKWITDNSKGPRHAEPAFVPGTITTEIGARSWQIMNRYLEYLKAGNTPLHPT